MRDDAVGEGHALLKISAGCGEDGEVEWGGRDEVGG